jgi:uncharacterized SAM-dependent methyltransferase
MKVEVVLTEADIAQEFLEAIEARDLPEKLFFWFPRCAVAWSELAKDEALYGGLKKTWEAIASRAAAITADFKGKVPIISFGAGDGQRDRLLIAALRHAGREVQYFPVDASQAMLELACAAGDDEDTETIGIKADISSPVHLVYAADAAEAPRIFIMSGNTLGAFDPLAEIRYLAQAMSANDRLLIDGELHEEAVTLARRDSPAVRNFVGAMLSGMGVSKNDGQIRFDQKRDDRHKGLFLLARHFRAERDFSATVAGDDFPFQRGERIGFNFQYTYTPEAFRWLVGEHGGLDVIEEFPSPDGRFLTLLCKK